MEKKFGHIHGFILAGGESRRFGGNKALYPFRNKPLINHPLDRLAEHFHHFAIIAKNSSSFSVLDYKILDDLVSYQTPLAGIYTGLCHTDTDWNFFIGCDMPFMTVEVVERLAGVISETREELEIVVPRTSDGLQPLAAFYNKSLKSEFIDTVRLSHSVIDFIRRRNTKVIDFESAKPFTNVNTKEQLKDID